MRDVRLVPRLAAERLVAGKARGSHAHAGNADALHAALGHDDGIHLIAHVHDARRLVAETLGKTGEHIAPLDHV